MKVVMKARELVSRAGQWLTALAVQGMALAGNGNGTFQVNQGSDVLTYADNQAGTKTLNNAFTNIGNAAAQGINLFLIICAVVGIVTFALSVYGFYKASKDEREPQKQLYVGVLVGGAMTAIPILIAFARNTVAS